MKLTDLLWPFLPEEVMKDLPVNNTFPAGQYVAGNREFSYPDRAKGCPAVYVTKIRVNIFDCILGYFHCVSHGAAPWFNLTQFNPNGGWREHWAKFAGEEVADKT